MVTAGGIQAMVEAMREHLFDDLVYSSGPAEPLEVHKHAAMANAGGGEAMMTALSMHPYDESVPVYGCSALWMVLSATHEESKIAIVTADGV